MADGSDYKQADGHEPEPKGDQAPKRTRYIIFFAIGILTTIIGRCFEIHNWSANAVAYNLGRISGPLISYFAILGSIALVVAALRGSIKKYWFCTLAWLFLVAGLFDIVVKGYTEFVLRPQLVEAVEDLARTGKLDLGRDLDPRQRLIGHWASEDDLTHLFYSSKRLTIVNLGLRKDATYEVLDFSVMEHWIRYNVSGAGFDTHERTMHYLGDGTAWQVSEIPGIGPVKSKLKYMGPEQSP